MSTINKWKSTNIYGNLNIYPLFSDASGTTLIQDAGIHTDGSLSCASLSIGSTDISNIYATQADVSGNYQRIDNMVDYPTFTEVNAQFQQIVDMPNYLTTADASGYYQPISNMSAYVTSLDTSGFVRQDSSANVYLVNDLHVKVQSSATLNNTQIQTISDDASFLYNINVPNPETDYFIYHFANGDVNYNAANSMYLKIGDVDQAIITSEALSLQHNLVVNGDTYLHGEDINTIFQPILTTSSDVTIRSLNIGSTKTVSGIQFGVVNPPSNGTYTVVFPNTFASTPIVTTTLVYSGLSYPTVNAFIVSTSTTSFQFNVVFSSGTHAEAYVMVNWIAIC